MLVVILSGKPAACDGLRMGEPPPLLELSGTAGGRVNGLSWSSSELRGRVTTVMYVDPDERAVNGRLEEALRAENFPGSTSGSVVIVNSAATWLPQVVVLSLVRTKQEAWPDTVFVVDNDKRLVGEWCAEDDSYVVMAFNAQSELFFHAAHPLDDTEIKSLIAAIWAAIRDNDEHNAPVATQDSRAGS